MRMIAVDYGAARTGLAVSDYTGTIATPLGVIREKSLNELVGKILLAAAENEAVEIVVGNPINMDGSKGEKSAKCELLAAKLCERLEESGTPLPVVLWDERLTTVQAHGIMNVNNVRGAKRAERIDGVAAALILDGYLGFKKRNARGSAPNPA